MFSRSQAAGWLGKDVADGQLSYPGESGCQWNATDNDGYVGIQVLRAEYFEPHSAAAGFQRLIGIGDDAFSEPGLFGDWTSGALIRDRLAVVVMVKGPGDAAAKAISVLREVLPRIVPGNQAPASGVATTNPGG